MHYKDIHNLCYNALYIVINNFYSS